MAMTIQLPYGRKITENLFLLFTDLVAKSNVKKRIICILTRIEDFVSSGT